jgi:hypothetical protein
MLQAGYGERTITPPLGTELTGFGFYLDRRAEAVLDDLKVRALFLQVRAQSLLLVSCDLLGFTVSFSDRVRRELASDLKIPASHILLSTTHTHSGPATMPLAGLGKPNPAYLRTLPAAIRAAAWAAVSSAEEAEFGHHREAVEPIGFNRRRRDFAEIDPWLKTAVFRRKKSKIYLLNYACHPVILGPTRKISADWPGAVIRELEAAGHRGLVLQGFCGDIDPVAYLNRRLGATADDSTLCGKILAARCVKSENFMEFEAEADLQAAGRRIRLPLRIFRRKDLERETREAEEATRGFPQAGRVVRAWRKRVERNLNRFRVNPWHEDVPIQALAIGGLKILGLPGEVFCGYGLALQKTWPALMTAGYAGGNVGYLPTRKAYRAPNDYACSCAPKFYAVFPFSPETESVLFRESRKLLTFVGLERSSG